MNSKIANRILLDLLIFLVIIHGWWFIALPLVLIGISKYTYFFELILAGLMYDSLFGLVPGMRISGYIGILTSTAIFIVVSLLKKVLRK